MADNEICSICLEEVDLEVVIHRTEQLQQPRPVAVLACGHQFHLDCIFNAFCSWQGLKCPYCRQTQPGDLIRLGQSNPRQRRSSHITIRSNDPEEINIIDNFPASEGVHIRFDTQDDEDPQDSDFIVLLQGHLRCLYRIANERLEFLRHNRLEEERKLTRADAEQWGNSAVRRSCDTLGLLVNQENAVREIMEWTIQYQNQLRQQEALPRPRPSSDIIQSVHQFISEQIQATRYALNTLQRSQAVMCMPAREISLGQRIGRLLSIQRELGAYVRA